MPFTDGVEMIDCPECGGSGGTTCHHCGHFDPYCPMCEGTGEIPKQAKPKRSKRVKGE